MSLSQTPLQMENSFPSWLRSTPFTYDFVPAVCWTQRPNNEIPERCHLIVNSLETHGDNTRRSYLHFLLPYDFVPAIYKTSLVARYSRIPRNISPARNQSPDTCSVDRLHLGLTMGALQRQCGSKREIRSERDQQLEAVRKQHTSRTHRC